MLRFVLRRIVLMGLMLVGLLAITFTISHVAPADPAALAAGPDATVEMIERYRAELGLDRPLHALGALVEDPPGAENVVSNLGVAHVGVGGQPDGGAMREQRAVQGATLAQPVEGRRMGGCDRVEGIGRAHPDAIHDGQHHRPIRSRQGGMWA